MLKEKYIKQNSPQKPNSDFKTHSPLYVSPPVNCKNCPAKLPQKSTDVLNECKRITSYSPSPVKIEAQNTVTHYPFHASPPVNCKDSPCKLHVHVPLKSAPTADVNSKSECKQSVSHETQNTVKKWNELQPALQFILPPDDMYSYVVESYIAINSESATSDSPHFSATIRINLTKEEDANKWMESMSNHSKCTYRVTKTVTACMKKISCKFVKHCQHYAKKLSPKQAEKSAISRVHKKGKAPLTSQVRKKKTNCPSSFTLVIQIPTKTQIENAKSQPHLLTHHGVLKINFDHNHPVQAAHTLSFRDVSKETKKELSDLFEIGHNASSARHAHEQKLLYEADTDTQVILADRAQNPNLQDVCRLYDRWRIGNYGDYNGQGLFEKLQQTVDTYNHNQNKINRGQAILQCYDTGEVESSNISDNEEDTPPPKKKKKIKSTPMILALCTPIMRRAHQYVQQSRDVVFLDATSSFDRHNSSIFLLSTVTPAGAVPLGVFVTSDEQKETIIEGLKCLSSILPQNAFFGEGPQKGPSLVMIDDSSTERDALTAVWKSSTPLLCTFHFLQRRWTWLHDSKNGVRIKEHRIALIKEVKKLVYAEKEHQLEDLYSKMKQSEIAKCYQQFLSHMESLWLRRKQWAHCYRKRLLLRGNHTNNYSEAGIKILKELIFSRVKAYNMVQVFYFLSETLESYYCRKLLSISNNRLNNYISFRFQGLHATTIPKNNIVETSHKNVFVVKSKSERGVVYTVDMSVGVCTCPQGMDGSPCSHQAAVAINYDKASINCIPTLAPNVRQIYATIALGVKADKNPAFYASLHDKAMTNNMEVDMFNPNYNSQSMHLLQSVIESDNNDENVSANLSSNDMLQSRIQAAQSLIDEIAEDLKHKLEEKNEQLLHSIEKFSSRYESLKGSIPLLTSSLYRFGWTFGGSITSRKGGHLRHGRRISVQATAAGRRKGAKSRGKAKATSGAPIKSLSSKNSTLVSRYSMPTRRTIQGRRAHSLTYNIEKGQQNAGKW